MNNTDIIHFTAATAYARKINVSPQLVRLTGGHRGQTAKLDLGYLIIEKRWYPTNKS